MIYTAMLAWGLVSGPTLMAVDAEPLTILVNYGALGIVVLGFVTGHIRTKAEVTGLEHQITSLRNIIAAFQTAATQQTIPALTRSAEVLEAIPQNDATSLRDMEALIRRLEELAGRDTR